MGLRSVLGFELFHERSGGEIALAFEHKERRAKRPGEPSERPRGDFNGDGRIGAGVFAHTIDDHVRQEPSGMINEGTAYDYALRVKHTDEITDGKADVQRRFVERFQCDRLAGNGGAADRVDGE